MLDTQQRLRYSRAMLVPEIGQEGQQALLDTKLLIIGAGGLGCPLLLYLVASGVGTIGIVEDDTLEISNLQRQILYTCEDLDYPKTSAAFLRLKALNPDITLTTHPTRLDSSNAADIFKHYDIIADGSDNFATRFLVNKTCIALKKPLFSAAIQGWNGQLALFEGYKDNEPCYQCMVPQAIEHENLSCDAVGVVGPTAGIMGTMQAQEIIKYIAARKSVTAGELIRYNGLTQQLRKSRVQQDPGCIFHGANKVNSQETLASQLQE